MRYAPRLALLRLIAALTAGLIFQPAAQAQTPPMGYYLLATKPLDDGCRLLSFFFLDPALYEQFGDDLTLAVFQVKQRLVSAPPEPFDIVSLSGDDGPHEQYQGVADLPLPCDKVRSVEVVEARCEMYYLVLPLTPAMRSTYLAFDDCLGPLPRTVSVTICLDSDNPTLDLPIIPQAPFEAIPLWK